ncbi:vesicle-associated membrane protein 7-like [Lytechinus pictus]|uniref:vesicle-associated membrane protein 7-like n=1 Tax=Lytechinus variegatus TaxID=7654 RepID=UPI001BB1D87A|nr:vesicle-associated membrane protein 7-like [Lytechinus variegatus]XP_054773826.1 vesicle-associated membrane protein 7-like [Lytechinus pictus]
MTILYSCIARGTTILVELSKSYEHNFQQVVGSMMQNLASHDNFKSVYTSQDYLFHVVIKDRITYMCATTVDFRRQTAYSFIMEIMSKVANCSLAQRVHHAGEMELERDFSSVLGQEMDHFSNLKGGGNDKVAVLQNQVDEVKDIMTVNIDKVLSRGEKLDDLLSKTEDLEASAKTFQKTARKVNDKMWWQNIRMKILLTVIIFIVVIAILLIGLHLGGVI